ncbi:hypothetical protein QQ008_13585 [Fulvivirgaceae bacterium BMA10]|uniref:Uncharacterized protein n=1 Tax=Splendidivirga corallicola TaxID=3051826 RepID=A0ABT8KS04_9BACT|nr:hypothetical protein [Fulvivirgaceae bacterium BMA10]
MLKKYSIYFKIANYLILIHALGHFYGHLTTFVNYGSASSELKALFSSMQQTQTDGGNGIWDLFIMFSISYTIFQVIISVINLVIIYSPEIGLKAMKRIVLANLLLWISSFTLFYQINVKITWISNALFVFFFMISFILISTKATKGAHT